MWRKKRFHKKQFGVSSFRTRNKTKAVSRVLKILPFFLVIPLIVLAFYLIKTGFLTIKNIEVENVKADCFEIDQLKQSSNLLGKSMLFADFSKIEINLKKKYYCIKSINLEKTFPDTVKLQIFNRLPLVGLISYKDNEASVSSIIENISTPSASQSGEFYIMDDEGVIFSKDNNEINIPKLYVSNETLSLGKTLISDHIGFIIKILEKIKVFGVEIKEGFISGDNFIVFSQRPIQKIIFRLNDKIDLQLASLQLILAEAKINQRTISGDTESSVKEFEFIDLRFDKPIIKYTPIKK